MVVGDAGGGEGGERRVTLRWEVWGNDRSGESDSTVFWFFHESERPCCLQLAVTSISMVSLCLTWVWSI